MRTLLAMAALLSLGAATAVAQQEKGDKEVGIGGQFFFNNTKGSRSGDASFQFSLGYFMSGKNYIGFEVDPTVSISTIKAQSGTSSSTTTTAGGFFGSNYRRMLGSGQGKVFFFVGGGGGAYVLGGSNFGTVFPEVGLKSYVSQKTSLEFSFKMLYEVNGLPKGTTFADRLENQFTISVRHVF